MTTTRVRLDLSDPDLYVPDGAMFPVWDHLRETAPLYLNERADGTAFWAVTSHPLAVAVYENRTDFTSERGMRVGGEGLGGRASAGKMLIVTDGSRHRAMRDIIGPAFGPRSIKRLEDSMREVVARLLTALPAGQPFDFVDRVASRLPLYVTCDLLGIPREDWDQMIELTRTAFGSVSEDGGDIISPREQEEAHADIFLYAQDLIARRRRDPHDDLISAMTQGVSGEFQMSDEEIQVNINGILTGGNETTRHATAGGVLAFIRNPDQWVRMKNNRSLMPHAIEEILRITAPSLHVMRTAVCHTEVGGQHIRAGEQVTIWNPAVNHDPAAFSSPRTFDIDRWPNRHLTFGLGQHFCIGATLARLEIRVVLEALLSSVHHFESAGEIRRLRSNLMWGLDAMPVRVHLEETNA